MTVLKETSGETVACDGCGRTDAGPNQALHIQPFTVNDPNIGSAVGHHYCAGCASNRGLAEAAATIAGWEASTVPAASEDRSYMRADVPAGRNVLEASPEPTQSA